MSPICLLLLPAVVYGKISVYVDLRTDPPLIDVTGQSSILIPEAERAAFHIDDEQLKKSVANYSGVTPTDVLVRNSWGGLYKNNDWLEVTRTVKPTLKTITDASFSPQCKSLDLNLKDANLTVTSVWGNTTLSAAEKSDYTFLHQSPAFKFNSSWGQKIQESQKYSFAVPKVTVTKCVVNVYLEYEARLSGYIAANYQGKREGHHFWAFDVNNVQKKMGLPTSVLHQENITIQYFK